VRIFGRLVAITSHWCNWRPWFQCGWEICIASPGSATQ